MKYSWESKTPIPDCHNYRLQQEERGSNPTSKYTGSNEQTISVLSSSTFVIETGRGKLVRCVLEAIELVTSGLAVTICCVELASREWGLLDKWILMREGNVWVRCGPSSLKLSWFLVNVFRARPSVNPRCSFLACERWPTPWRTHWSLMSKIPNALSYSEIQSGQSSRPRSFRHHSCSQAKMQSVDVLEQSAKLWNLERFSFFSYENHLH